MISRRRTSTAAVAVMLAIAVPAAVMPSAASANGDEPGRIAFTRPLEGGGAQVFSAAPDGSDEHIVPLPYVAEDFARAIWSHDGTKLLISTFFRFDEKGDLLPFRPGTVNPDGSDFQLLTMPMLPFDTFCAAWSPDDERLLCEIGGDEPGIVSVRASDGGDARRLTTTTPEMADTPIGYSPDGSRFAFIRKSTPSFHSRAPRSNEQGALFLADADGSDVRQITPFGLVMNHELATSAWTPDGKWLVTGTPRGDLVRVSVERGAVSPIHLGVNRSFAYAPSLSPDGSRVIFSLGSASGDDLYTADLDGGNLQQITHSEGADWFGNWGVTR